MHSLLLEAHQWHSVSHCYQQYQAIPFAGAESNVLKFLMENTLTVPVDGVAFCVLNVQQKKRQLMHGHTFRHGMTDTRPLLVLTMSTVRFDVAGQGS